MRNRESDPGQNGEEEENEEREDISWTRTGRNEGGGGVLEVKKKDEEVRGQDGEE